MRTEVIVYTVNHYDMNESRGLNVRILGDEVQTNNKFGVEISEAAVENYNELRYLQNFGPKDFPAKFKANIRFVSVKSTGGKEKTGVALSDLEFINSMDLVDRKVPVVK